MKHTRVAIVGGGLAGLYAARQLARLGVDHLILEARETVGGRILSRPVSASPSRPPQGPVLGPQARDRFDLGATWYWPSLQPQLHRLIEASGLGTFVQPDGGDWLLERSHVAPPQRVGGHPSSPPSMRLLGGMAALTEALTSTLAPERLRVGHAVTRLRAVGDGVHLQIAVRESDGEGNGNATVDLLADRVILAVPPRIAASAIDFSPALPARLAQDWSGTPTWMAPHAKYLAVYDTPFWRQEGLAGSARSTVGPMGEIHDASMPGASAALFGFIGLPAQVRGGIGQHALIQACRAQLVRLFGARAAEPRAEWLQDWARERHTATPRDDTAQGHGTSSPAAEPETGVWRHRIVGGASEWSPEFPGYLAGAVDAAERAVQRVSAAAGHDTRGTPT